MAFESTALSLHDAHYINNFHDTIAGIAECTQQRKTQTEMTQYLVHITLQAVPQDVAGV